MNRPFCSAKLKAKNLLASCGIWTTNDWIQRAILGKTESLTNLNPLAWIVNVEISLWPFRYTIREEILPTGVLSDLSIKKLERTDSALFTCVATNAFGSDDTSINLIVQGIYYLFLLLILIKNLTTKLFVWIAEPPEVPFGVKVLDKSGRSVQLSWSAPYDGNSPLTRYLIEYKISKGLDHFEFLLIVIKMKLIDWKM